MPASVTSKPLPSSSTTRSASGPFPGLAGSRGCFSFHRSHPARATDAMRALLQFLLLATDGPLDEFYDATNVWVLTRRARLRNALAGMR